MVLDGNPIGVVGGRAVLRALHWIGRFGWRRRISIAGCNYDYNSDAAAAMFDPAEPAGEYELVPPPISARTRALYVAPSCCIFLNRAAWRLQDLGQPYDRCVAWELIEAAWAQPGENWQGETLDGKVFELPEPGPGESWDRSAFILPEYGTLKLTFVATRRPPEITDAVGPAMLATLRALIEAAGALQDSGADLLRLAAADCWFTAEMIGLFVGMMKDPVGRVQVCPGR